jgi:hypothetical protein
MNGLNTSALNFVSDEEEDEVSQFSSTFPATLPPLWYKSFLAKPLLLSKSESLHTVYSFSNSVEDLCSPPLEERLIYLHFRYYLHYYCFLPPRNKNFSCLLGGG